MSGTLEPLAPGVFAWLSAEDSRSATNFGLVIAADGLTVVDAGPSPSATQPFVEAIGELTELPVRRVVLTGSHIDVCGGSASFPLAAIYGSGQTSAHLDQAPNPDVWQRLHPGYDFTEVEARPVSHTVAEAAHVDPAAIAVPVSGPQFESLLVQVPAANVVFAGAVASFGQIPLGYDADFPRWIETLEQMKGWGELFVPAHGRVGGVEEIEEFQAYLRACIDARGDVGALTNGPWDSWSHQEHSAINVERAHMLATGDPSPPPAMLALIGK